LPRHHRRLKTDNPQIRTVLRARVVMPVSGPPIEDGAVVIQGNRIISVSKFRTSQLSNTEELQDLGEVILLPGLVNAHCHLDYTNLAGQIVPPATFTDWIKLIMAGKSGWTYSDFAESWVAGAQMLLRTGTTTVGDIEMAPELLPEVWASSPLRVYSFLEMTGVKSRRPPAEIIGEAMDRIVSLPAGRCRAGLSPHAPYSTTPELSRLSAESAKKKNLRVTTHVSESVEEFEMFTRGKGEMFHWLARSGRDMGDCGMGSPIQHLERNGALDERLLAVHVNCLAPGDAALLAKRKVSVVHCPRSHSYFKHPKFPFEELTSAGINICLGTDSLASVYKGRKETVELNMFEEMRTFSRNHPELEPKKVVEMATINSARALGMNGEVGELSPGAFADIIALPFRGKLSEAFEAVLEHKGDVAARMIDGQWVVGA
jgi:cytosine/adenosine deaminase-related metal-dependent hydrolase